MHIQLTLVIHSSVDGHLSCFYILAIVNNAAKTWVYEYLLFKFMLSIILGIYLEDNLLDHMIIQFFEDSVFLHFIFKNYYTVKLTSLFLLSGFLN